MSTLAFAVGVDLNILEALWIINHIQYKTVSDVSGGCRASELVGNIHDCEKEPLDERLNNAEG